MNEEQQLFYKELFRIQEYHDELKIFKGDTEAKLYSIINKLEVNLIRNSSDMMSIISIEELEIYVMIYILHYDSHYKEISMNLNLAQIINAYKFNKYLAAAFQYFAYTLDSREINYNILELISLDYTYENITNLYKYITEPDKLKLLKTIEMVVSNSYGKEILMYRLDSNYAIHFNRIEMCSEIYLSQYNKYVKPIHMDILSTAAKILNYTNSIYNFNHILMETYKLIFIMNSDILNDNDYEIMAIIMDTKSFQEARVITAGAICGQDESFSKLAKAYINYVSTRNHSVIQNRMPKLIKAKQDAIIHVRGTDESANLFFGSILFKEMINYDGDNKFLLKLIIDSQI